jgi:AcrR family transcriptional regulator
VAEPGTRSIPESTRERRQRKRRDEVALAAIRLFHERGFDAVTVDEISEAADIAPRTFFRYFATKEDVFFTDRFEQLDALREAIAARPPDEPILASVRHAILTVFDQYHLGPEPRLLAARVVADTPALRAGSIARQAEWQHALAAMVAERLGVDPGVDLRPHVVASTTLAALRSAMDLWVANDGRDDLIGLANQALDLLDGGLQHTSDLGRPTT